MRSILGQITALLPVVIALAQEDTTTVINIPTYTAGDGLVLTTYTATDIPTYTAADGTGLTTITTNIPTLTATGETNTTAYTTIDASNAPTQTATDVIISSFQATSTVSTTTHPGTSQPAPSPFAGLGSRTQVVDIFTLVIVAGVAIFASAF